MKNLVLLLIPLTLVVGGISIWKGRGAERLGGIALVMTLVAQFGTMAVASTLGIPLRDIVPWLDVLLSIYLAGSFLIAAIKFASPWLGFACLIQALEMAITAAYNPHTMGALYQSYLGLLNTMTLLIVGVLAAATVRSIIVRRAGPFSEHEMKGTRMVSFTSAPGVIAAMWPQATDWPWRLMFVKRQKRS